MSYDLILRSDERHAEATDPAPVREAIAAALGIDAAGQLHWREGDDYVQFDLSTVNEGGDAVPRPDLGGMVNAIHCHMSRGSYGVAWVVRKRATEAALAAARLSGWRVFDPQLDQFLDDFRHRWRAELVPTARPLRGVRRSPDGVHVAFVSDELRVLVAATGERLPLRLPTHHGDARWVEPGRLAVRTGEHDEGVVSIVDLEGRRHGAARPAPWIDRFAPVGDGRVLLADGTLADTARDESSQPFESDTGPVALSPDGRLAALRDGVFDLQRGARILDYDVIDRKMNVAAAVFSPDGAILATGGYDRRIVLWGVGKTSIQPTHVIKRCGQINDLCFSPDGATLISGSDTAVVRLWSVETGKGVGSLKPPGAFTIWDDYTGRLAPKARVSKRLTRSVEFLDAGRLATTHNDGRACVWDFAERSLVASLAFGPGDAWLVIAGDGGAHEHDGGFESVRLGWITDAAFYAECLTRDSLPGAFTPGLLARTLSGRG